MSRRGFWSGLGFKPKLSLAVGGLTGIAALAMGTGLLLGGIAAVAATTITWNTLEPKQRNDES